MTQTSTPSLVFQFQDMTIALVNHDWTGHEQLYVNDQLVSEQRSFRFSSTHHFQWQDQPWEFRFSISTKDLTANCQLFANQQLVDEQQQPYQPTGKFNKALLDKLSAGDMLPQDAAAKTTANVPPAQVSEPPKAKSHTITWIAIGLKLLKSAKAIQIALVGASVASYSFLFDWRFAVIIVMALMFHEYGHLRAMKKMGMKVKGMYLIPFIGGAAVSSDRIQTRWENVYISMMGPVYGLLMTIAFFIIYRLTNHSLAAGLASFSALLNLINLLPIFPLDGGQVLKSIAYSLHSKIGKATLWFGVALSIFITWQIGLSLFAFLTIIGALDLLFGDSPAQEAQITPLTGPGIVVSVVWYLGTAAALIGMILVMSSMGIAGSQLVTQILGS